MRARLKKDTKPALEICAIPEKKHGDLRVLFWNVQDFGHYSKIPIDSQRRRYLSALITASKADIALIAEVHRDRVRRGLIRIIKDEVFQGHLVYRGQSKKAIMALFNRKAGGFAEITEGNFNDNVSSWSGAIFPIIEIYKRGKRPLEIMGVHTKCGVTRAAYDIRAGILGKIAQYGRRVEGRKRSLIAVGDFNTMGYGGLINGAEEIRRSAHFLQSNGGMNKLDKNYDYTWLGIHHDAQFPVSDLDHVFCSSSIAESVRRFGNDESPHQVHVGGWKNIPHTEQEKWVERHSDHNFLIFDLAGYGLE